VKILLANGQLVDPGAGVHGRRDILVSGGRVRAVAPCLAPFEQWLEGEGDRLCVYDLAGRHVFPGLVDIHTHLRVPGQEHKEDLVSGTRAAAWGGFTTVLTMPNTRPCVDRVPVLRALRRRIDAEAVVRVGVVACVTRGQAGKRLSPLEALRREGAVAFSDDGRPVMDAGVMRRALAAARELGVPVISHCEDLNLAGGGVIREGAVARRLGLAGIPASAEQVMVARDLCLARETGAHVHLAHLSTAGSVDMVRLAKERGVRVTAEATPHHLLLTDEAVLVHGTDAKVNPPLCGPEDREALRNALRDGTLDAVASDHAPHHPREKALPMAEAPFGIIGLETTLSVVLTLVAQGVVSLARAVELLSAGPARAMGLPCGSLRVGEAADLVVVEADRPVRVDVGRLRSRARNCPFRGMSLKGVPVLTLKDGEIVMKKRPLAPPERWLKKSERGKR